MKNPGLAALFSTLWPGTGQIYNGQIGKGLSIVILPIPTIMFLMIFSGYSWLLVMPMIWIWSIYDAHVAATKINATLTRLSH